MSDKPTEPGDHRPARVPEGEKTPLGLARNDTLNMAEAWAKYPRPAVAPYKPPKKGKPWWKQPPEER